MVLAVAGCSQRQFESYLLDSGQGKEKTAHHSPEPVNQQTTAVLSGDEFMAVKKVYSITLPSSELLTESNISMLGTAKKDLEAFYLIAKHMRASNKTEDLRIIEGFAREYIAEGIDSFLSRDIAKDSDQVKKILFDMQYLKALLLYEIKDIVHACETIRTLDARFSQNMNVDSDFVAKGFQKPLSHMVITDFKYLCEGNINNKALY